MQRAEEVGSWFGVPVLLRRRRSVQAMFDDEGVDVILVADEFVTIYHRSDAQTPIFFHPGMAMQRIRGLNKGQSDRMIEAAGIRSNDSVLDATLGHGADSLVAAHVVGDAGRVIGIEASWYLVRLFQFAQTHAAMQFPRIERDLRRIEAYAGNHLDFLRSMGENTVDVVLFDPMFRLPPKHHTDLAAHRPLSYPWRLTEEAFREAKRVARRAVVLKERPGFGELERFGLLPDKPKARFAYGVWRKDGLTSCFRDSSGQ